MKGYVLDANAIISYLEADQGSHKVEQLLEQASRRQLLLYISVLNLGEVYYLTWRRTGEENARRAIAGFSRMPIQIVSVDLRQSLKAAELKAMHSIPYVDCIAAALASLHQATLVTADRHFEKLGRHFPVLWISHS
jgi:predicted nucleic acid-binding protein